MHDEEISAERNRPDEFIMKCLNGTRAQHRLLGREVDQVVGVDHQRTKAQGFAPRAESAGVKLWNARRAASPHSRTGREDLQRITA